MHLPARCWQLQTRLTATLTARRNDSTMPPAEGRTVSVSRSLYMFHTLGSRNLWVRYFLWLSFIYSLGNYYFYLAKNNTFLSAKKKKKKSHSLSLPEAKFSKNRISQDHLGAVGRGINILQGLWAVVKEGTSGVISRDHLLTKNRNPLKQI